MLFPNLRIDCCSFAKSLPTLCDTMDGKMPGFSVCGISQARLQEQIAISLSRESSGPRQ